MQLTDQQKAKMFEHGIPDHMHGAIIRYYENGLEPGHFLTAVINNDLREACARADDFNKHKLFNYVLWFYNHGPSGSWGYPGAAERWIKQFHEEKVSESVPD